MNRQAVRDNARYLRNVRPVDPEEISEYIDGQPHPAVVRRTLREEAFDLGLFEREDGTFVPAEEVPVPDPGWRPTAFPESWAFAFEDLLVREFGANWHRGDSGDALREAIRRLKADYFFENPVEYDGTAALGYGVYHLPDYYAAVGYVLDDLVENGLLPHRLRVLDVGAGVGGPALGLHDYLPEAALVDYHAVEPSAASEVLSGLLAETRRNFRTTIHETTAEAFDPAEPLPADDDDPTGYDLILFGNVLSELDDPVVVVERYLDSLASDGTLLGLAPADLNTSTGLREVERAVAPADGDVTVYSPALRLWPGHAPSDRGWSFDERDPVESPGFQRRLAEAAADPEEFRKESVRFSYSLLRRDGRRRHGVTANAERFAKMAEMDRHVTNRIDLLAVKLSGDLADGDNPLFKVGDGSEAVEHYAVLTNDSVLTSDLADAEYGAVLAFENVLSLWNDDEEAYNLVADDEAVVDLVAGDLRH
jgi:SAM-dependent methyltransferase